MEHLVGCFFAVLHSAHEPLSLGTPLRIYQEHSSNSSTLGMQPPMSPVSPSENPPSIHNPGFSWAYQQPVIIGGENFTQTLPLLPAVQASTPTTQNHAFFKAF